MERQVVVIILGILYSFRYAMETKCHSGYVCEYITRKDAPPPRIATNYGYEQDQPFYSTRQLDQMDVNWRLSIVHHRIIPVIKEVIEKYPVPPCVQPVNCNDCLSWTFQ